MSNSFEKIATNQQNLKNGILKSPELKSTARTLSQQVSCSSKVPLVEVDDYLSLVQLCGFFKYNIGTGILYRGQVNLYPTLQPTLFRKNSQKEKEKELDEMIDLLRCFGVIDPSVKVVKAAKNNKQKDLSTEPMLQHYGIDTRWLDVVDSIPHALFFAINKYSKSELKKNRSTFVPSVNEYGYLYLINTGEKRKRVDSNVNGIWKTEKGLTICDLRTAKPSLVLRPHSQHGLLIKGRPKEQDLWDRLELIIRFKCEKAKRWIGGDAFSREIFIPSTSKDLAYRNLMSYKMEEFKKAYPKYAHLLNIVDYDFN